APGLRRPSAAASITTGWRDGRLRLGVRQEPGGDLVREVGRERRDVRAVLDRPQLGAAARIAAVAPHERARLGAGHADLEVPRLALDRGRAAAAVLRPRAG